MNIEIQIPAETDAKFRERAAAEGRDPADLALKALHENLGVTDGSSASSRREGRAAAWNRFVPTCTSGRVPFRPGTSSMTAGRVRTPVEALAGWPPAAKL